MKVNATEAIWETEQPAGCVPIALIDEREPTQHFEIRSRRIIISVLQNFSGEVVGSGS